MLAAIGATLNSGARTVEAVLWARKQGAVLSSQQELFDDFQRDPVHFNPANPPGQSTHEGKNDGAAYRFWPKFFSLPWWAWGMDIWPSDGAVEEFNKHGFSAAITYPGNPREGHHVNLRKKPSKRAWKWVHRATFPVLKKGDRGKRVGTMTKRLVYLGWLDHDPTGNFDERVHDALASFQRHYGQHADGVYGYQTNHQLLIAVRGKKQCRKLAMKTFKGHPKQLDDALDKCNHRFGPARR